MPAMYAWRHKKGHRYSHLCVRHDEDVTPGGLMTSLCCPPSMRRPGGIGYTPSRELDWPKKAHCPKCEAALAAWKGPCYLVKKALGDFFDSSAGC